MKTCTICKTEKDECEFNFRIKKDNTRYAHCKSCQKILRKNAYQKNKDYYLNKDKISTAARRHEKLKLIRSFKENVPCKDCRIIYPYYVMDFDHLPQFEKEIPISTKGHYCSLERILKEISKCEIVCSNCHRIRTYNRKKMADSNRIEQLSRMVTDTTVFKTV